MHVARNKSSYVAKSGEERVYESVLLRRTYREGGKVKHETLANLSRLPAEAVTALEATLKGQTLVAAGSEFSIVAVAAARARGRGRRDGAPAGPAHAAGAGGVGRGTSLSR